MTETRAGTRAAAALPRSAPETQGIASAAIRAFIEAAEATLHDLHSVMLVHHGSVVAEGWWAPYGPDRPHMLFSLSKSFTSTAAGLAVAEGRFALDDPVVGFFPDKRPAVVSENLAAMRVRDLLTMTAGHVKDTTPALRGRADGDWVAAFLEQPVAHAPGTRFVYNSGATYMVSAIVQKTTGQRVLDYLRPRLFEPLGIADPAWQTCPRGIDTGGWGLSVRTEDIAKFGQLYLRKGLWDGRRLLPDGWVEQATAFQVPNGDKPDSDWSEGYGFQFWRCRHGAYRGDGAFGQFCVVLPKQDAVLAITAGVGDMQAVLNVVWETLLPAFGAAPLPADPAAEAALRAKLAGLLLPAPKGMAESPLAAKVSGRAYRFEPNDDRWESIAFDFAPGRDTRVRIRKAGADHVVFAGTSGVWREGRTALSSDDGTAAIPVAASGAWQDDAYVLRLAYFETPWRSDFTVRFDEDAARVTVDRRLNVSFGPLDSPTLTGRAE